MKWTDLDRWIGRISEASDQLERASQGDFGMKKRLDAAVDKKLGKLDGGLERLTGASTKTGKRLVRVVDAIDKIGNGPAAKPKPEDRGQKAETRSQETEVKDQKAEVRSQKAEEKPS